jgi:hypothetical protein
MPSPARAADLERVLTRAAEECESKDGIWFGEGLPQTLRKAIEARGRSTGAEPAAIAFIEVGASDQSNAAAKQCPVVALSTSGLDALASLIEAVPTKVARLICADAVLDFTTEGVWVREVRHGLTAADLQAKLPMTLWAGPDLKELGTH